MDLQPLTESFLYVLLVALCLCAFLALLMTIFRRRIAWILPWKDTMPLAGGLLLLLVVLSVGWMAAIEVHAANKRIAENVVTRLQIAEVFSMMKDSETAQRGYILTLEESFLQPHIEVKGNIAKELADLEASLQGDPVQIDQMEGLAALVHAKVGFAEEMVSMARTQGSEAASAAVRAGRGKVLMDEIRSALGGMERIAEMNAMALETASRERTRHALFLFPLGGVLSLLLIGLTILRLNSEAASRRRGESRFRAIFDSVFQHVALLQVDGAVLEVNETALRFAGQKSHEVTGRKYWETFWWQSLEGASDTVRAAVERAATGELVRHTLKAAGADGRLATMDFSLKPVTDDRGGVTLLLAEGRDISARVQAQRSLRDSEERFRQAFDHAGIGMALVSIPGRFVRVNHALCELTGCDPDDLLQKNFADITLAADVDVDASLRQALLDGEEQGYHVVKRCKHSGGRTVITQLTVSLVKDASGAPLYFICQMVDVTEERQALTSVQEALAEREVLLREIHHRVKNNLQIISSLLSLQARTLEDPAMRVPFEESRQRVAAMALIHERLYGTRDLAHLDFRSYLGELVRQQVAAHPASSRIRLEIDVDVPPVPAEVAVPCALIIHELVSNALKHGFQGDQEGVLAVRMHDRQDHWKFSIANSASEAPVESIPNPKSLGLQIVHALVRQLKGHLTTEHENEYTVSVTFPPPGLR